MEYLYTINGYEIYEYSARVCLEYDKSYPCYGAFTPSSDHMPDYEECSRDTLDALIEWCEKN